MTEACSRLSAALSDRYRIERALGAGGRRPCISPRISNTTRKVAIKVLKPELAAERFVQQIKTTKVRPVVDRDVCGVSA
jgi:hypothetical protein